VPTKLNLWSGAFGTVTGTYDSAFKLAGLCSAGAVVRDDQRVHTELAKGAGARVFVTPEVRTPQ
jgi:hypothetical protein